MYIKALSHFQGPLQKHKSKTSTDIIPANMSTPDSLLFLALPAPCSATMASHTHRPPRQLQDRHQSGEPGLDLDTGKVVTSSVEAQSAPRSTRGCCVEERWCEKGIRAVYKFTVLMIDMKEEDFDADLAGGGPRQQAVFMAFGVNHLGLEGMRIELRAEAISRSSKLS
ncbi:unnamed protein product [Clonostachys rosea f. rosea IK726]|uniref:Uncharacterized protein n=1 Tax=Clonostachys rosea f. rosea IK726 TaxID=1349383 RepID=A0ACA9UDJ6_BIOOC|nr:unnamed protein product [Clonostachys rosea f. rosea IK726]